MYCKVKPIHQWDTASTDLDAATSPMELFHLAEHLGPRNDRRSGLFALQYCAQRLHHFLQAHFVSTLVFVVLLAVLGTHAI